MRIIKIFFCVVFFMVAGFFLFGWIGAIQMYGEQGFSGSATVAIWAFLGAFAGLVSSFFILRRTGKKLFMLFTLFGVITTFILLGLFIRGNTTEYLEPDTHHVPVKPVLLMQDSKSMGLGMAYPKVLNNTSIYFYNPNIQKSVDEHFPYDSISFVEKNWGPDISYAPPWFYPEMMKLDYGILVLKVISLSKEWIQVEVNKQTGRTAWLSIYDVDYVPWEKYILDMHSIEPLNLETNPVRARPVIHGSPVVLDDDVSLVPIEVRNEWLRVDIKNSNYESLGTGWIRWRGGNQLLISYYPLS